MPLISVLLNPNKSRHVSNIQKMVISDDGVLDFGYFTNKFKDSISIDVELNENEWLTLPVKDNKIQIETNYRSKMFKASYQVLPVANWKFDALMEWGNHFEFDTSQCSNKTNNVSEKKENNLSNLVLGTWDNFTIHFEHFLRLVGQKFENSLFVPVTDIRYTNTPFPDIRSYDHLHNNLMQILTSSLIERIFPKDETIHGIFSFLSRGNRCPNWSDIYLSSNVGPQERNDVAIAEVKTGAQLSAASDDQFFTRLSDKSSDVYSGLAQIVTDLINSNHVTKILILTNYECAWTFKLLVKDDLKVLLKSPMVKKKQFTQLFYFVSSLLSEKIADTVDGWKEYVKTDVLKDDKQYRTLKQFNQSGSTNQANLNNQHLVPLNENTEIGDQQDRNQHNNNWNQCQSEESYQCASDDSGVADLTMDATITWLDLFNTMSDWKVIGFGLCGLVKYAKIKEQNYAVKMCNLVKSPEYALEELKNEHKVLLQLRKIKEVADFVPRVHCFTNVWLAQVLVCDFIDGKVYANYDEMDKETKMACHQRVKQLHASNILHGDLRAPNFIVQDGDNVFVIDFGRSEILNKDSKSTKLDIEMENFLNELKL